MVWTFFNAISKTMYIAKKDENSLSSALGKTTCPDRHVNFQRVCLPSKLYVQCGLSWQTICCGFCLHIINVVEYDNRRNHKQIELVTFEIN